MEGEADGVRGDGVVKREGEMGGEETGRGEWRGGRRMGYLSLHIGGLLYIGVPLYIGVSLNKGTLPLYIKVPLCHGIYWSTLI